MLALVVNDAVLSTLIGTSFVLVTGFGAYIVRALKETAVLQATAAQQLRDHGERLAAHDDRITFLEQQRAGAERNRYL